MPKLTRRLPSYRLHKPSGRAVVSLEGRTHYLGRFGTPESRREYERIVQEWLARRRRGIPSAHFADLTINELIVSYLSHVDAYYVKDGLPTSEPDTIRQALRFLRRGYGSTSAADFGPLSLQTVRAAMIDHGLCRTYINRQVNRIRLMFGWAAANQLLPVSVHQTLGTVAGLRKGRSEARESCKVGPVPDATIEQTLPLVPPVVATMIRVQRLAGMRPQEVAAMRGDEIDRSDATCWEYRPGRHKTQHHERERLIFLGPQSQALLLPYLGAAEGGYLFSPERSEAERRVLLRVNRKSPMTPSQMARQPKPHTERRPGEHYSVASYRRAIRRACETLGIPVWFPNALRHAAATVIRSRFSLEHAQAVLGHAELGTTQVYAEVEFERAREVMRKIG